MDNGLASYMLSTLDTRFHSVTEQNIACVLIGVPGAQCNVPLVHRYEKRFKGHPFEWRDESWRASSESLL